MRTRANTNWRYIQNPFLNATQSSYKRFLILCSDNLSKLRDAKDEPAIASLLAEYEPLYLAFMDTFAEWRKTRAAYMAATARVKAVQKSLNRMIGIWDVRIQSVYYKDTVDYIAILPERRAPFQKGSRDERINRLLALSRSLANYPDLANVCNDVQQFYTKFLILRDEQQQLEGRVDEMSVQLQLAWEAAGDAMYRVMAGLMLRYGASIRVTNFFDLELIRRTSKEKQEEVNAERADEFENQKAEAGLEPEKNREEKGFAEPSLMFSIPSISFPEAFDMAEPFRVPETRVEVAGKGRMNGRSP